MATWWNQRQWICWVDFIRSIDAITLFGREFGDIIQPRDVAGMCSDWRTLPINNYYLSASILDLKNIMEVFGHIGFRISNFHVTQAATSNMDTINLDAGKTTADFSTVGLWCEQLKANFGQATLAAAGAGMSMSTASTGSTMSSTGSAPTPTSSKSGAPSVGVPNSALAMTLLAAVAFAMKICYALVRKVEDMEFFSNRSARSV